MKSKSTKNQPSLFKPFVEPWKPHKYQLKAVKFLLEHACAGLFLDPGLGKTSISLAAIKILKKKKLLNKVLIVAPLRVCHLVWPKQIEQWEDFNGLRYVVLHGPKKDELLKVDADIYIINPEGLDWLIKPIKTKNKNKTSVQVDVRAFKKLGFDTLIVDELTKFKNHQSIRFKAMKEVLGTFARRWGLTGSPVANGLLNLFGQMYMIDMGRALGKYVTHYRMEFFVPSYNGFTFDLQMDGEERIYERIAPTVLRMNGDDYLDLPKVIPNPIMVEMPESAWVTYLQFESELIATVDGKTFTAKNSGIAIGKCRQIASGAIYEEAGLGETPKRRVNGVRKHIEIHEAKLDALEDLIDELQGQPLMLAYEFNHDLERIQARFGGKKKNLPFIGKGVSTKDADRIAEDWNNGKIPLLPVQPTSVSHGLNLQGFSNHIGFFTLPYDFEAYDQLIRRLARQGSKHKRVFVHQIMAKDTVDEVVLATLAGKDHTQKSFFEGLVKMQRRRVRRS